MKKTKRSTIWPGMAVLAVLAAAAVSTLAYIDPGSGSYIFQLVVGAMVGTAVAVKVFWRRVLAFLSGRASRKP